MVTKLLVFEEEDNSYVPASSCYISHVYFHFICFSVILLIFYIPFFVLDHVR